MQQRFFLELIVFLVLAALFQIYIDKYNTGEQELAVRIKKWINDANLEKTLVGEAYLEEQAQINAELARVERLDLVALFIAFTSFAYPIRLITRIIYCRLTERKRHFKAEEWVELIFAASTFTWLGDVLAYKLGKNHGDGPEVPGLNKSYILSVIIELDSSESYFKMNFLLAVVAASFWFKVLMMLQLTKTFGPMIKIVVSMLKDLVTFLVLWII